MLYLRLWHTGVPCISVDCDTGPRDIISSGENGLLVPIDSTEHLTEAMKELMKDLYLAEILGKSAKNVGEEFSMETVGFKVGCFNLFFFKRL